MVLIIRKCAEKTAVVRVDKGRVWSTCKVWTKGGCGLLARCGQREGVVYWQGVDKGRVWSTCKV